MILDPRLIILLIVSYNEFIFSFNLFCLVFKEEFSLRIKKKKNLGISYQKEKLNLLLYKSECIIRGG